MNLENVKTKAKVVVYVLLGIIIAIIVVRVLLKLLGANEASQFAIFWYDLSDTFVRPFAGIYPSVAPRESNFIFETYSIVALIVYSLLAGIVSKSLTSISSVNNFTRAKEMLDVLFKVMEFFLVFRFILALTGASTEAGFVRFVYSASAIVYEPFAGIFPTFQFGANNQFVLEISTLIAIVIVVIFDIASDILIRTLRKTPPPAVHAPKIEEKVATPMPAPVAETQPSIGTMSQPAPVQPQPVMPAQSMSPMTPPVQPSVQNGYGNGYGISPTPPPQPQTDYQGVYGRPPAESFMQNPHRQGMDNSQYGTYQPTPPSPEPVNYVDRRSINVYPVAKPQADPGSNSFSTPNALDQPPTQNALPENTLPQLPTDNQSPQTPA